MSIDGILNILKPPGKTSFDVVSLVRRFSGEKRVGHAGTLDPDASGVLVLCLGQGTRILEFLAKANKTYYAEIVLGIATDTYDASGRIVSEADPSSVTRGQLITVLDSFHGVTEQTPPMYSALKHQGKRLYQLAREGIEVERKPRKVELSRLELLDWKSPVLSIEVECSAGTYIRSLADDIGQSLGCGAHLKKLVRLKSEPFHIADSVLLASIEEAFQQGQEQRFLYSIDEVLLGWKAVILDEEREKTIKTGTSISLGLDDCSACPEDRCRAYSADGRFLAVLSLQKESNLWHPDKVFQK